MASTKKILCLFDVDGTLTVPRQKIHKTTIDFLFHTIRPRATLALVGGSDFVKIVEQMNGPDVVENFEYVFAENGLVHYRRGRLQPNEQSLVEHFGEQKLQKFIDFVLAYLSHLELPRKRGTFIEFRRGILNISPIGRNCSQDERNEFEAMDRELLIRQRMINVLKARFPDFGLTYGIGGQISFDVFPTGWDKTYCLKHVEDEDFHQIHFFGDKTQKGGNDYELFNDPRVVGHHVDSPKDTMTQLSELFQL